jgi:predicted RNase H-like HicB family nuclease
MALTKELKKTVPLYTYRIEWSDEDQVFIVSVEELSGCMTHGKTQSEALKMGHEAVEGYLESLVDHKEEIPKPFSLQKFKGEFIVRATPELHKRIAVESNRKGYKSINKFVVETLEKAVG